MYMYTQILMHTYMYARTHTTACKRNCSYMCMYMVFIQTQSLYLHRLQTHTIKRISRFNLHYPNTTVRSIVYMYIYTNKCTNTHMHKYVHIKIYKQTTSTHTHTHTHTHSNREISPYKCPEVSCPRLYPPYNSQCSALWGQGMTQVNIGTIELHNPL